MAKKQHYMTYNERCKLEAYLRAGKTVTWIAREMGFSERTIYYEKKRGRYLYTNCAHGYYTDEIRYSADKAQDIHTYNQTAKGRPLKIGSDRAYADYLEEKILKEKRSPAAALAEARNAGFTTSVCTSTLYAYIDHHVFYQLTNNHLWEKPHRKKKEKQEARIAHPKLPSIEDRPEQIGQRQSRGHWEIDLVIGKQGSGAVLLVMAERTTRELILRKIPNKKASTVVAELDRLERTMPDFRDRIRSITTDNGSEFLDYEGMRRSIYSGIRCDIYYCHSFASWEKGTIERSNRLIRRFFPKGTNFSKITDAQVAAVQNWINNYPRKILDWKTPLELSA